MSFEKHYKGIMYPHAIYPASQKLQEHLRRF